MEKSNVELVKVKAMYRSSIIYNENSALEAEKLKEAARNILSKEIHESDENFIIYECITDGSLLTFNVLEHSEQDFYKKYVALDLEKAINVCLRTQHQNNDSWMWERRVRITCSKAYQLYTYVSNKNPEWHNKIRKFVLDSFKGNSNTRHGNLMEKNAIQAYTRQLDYEVTRMGLLINPSISWLGFSPDGIVLNSHIVEVKCPKEGRTNTASAVVTKLKYLEEDGKGNFVLKKKHQYYCQVQLGMFISNLHICHLVIYSSFDDSCYVIGINFEEELVFHKYLPKLQYVYFCYVLKFLADPVNNICNNNNNNENSDPNKC